GPERPPRAPLFPGLYVQGETDTERTERTKHGPRCVRFSMSEETSHVWQSLRSNTLTQSTSLYAIHPVCSSHELARSPAGGRVPARACGASADADPHAVVRARIVADCIRRCVGREPGGAVARRRAGLRGHVSRDCRSTRQRGARMLSRDRG